MPHYRCKQNVLTFDIQHAMHFIKVANSQTLTNHRNWPIGSVLPGDNVSGMSWQLADETNYPTYFTLSNSPSMQY